MATNIELNYYNGNQYEVLYPYVNLSNSTGNLSSSRISGNINAYTLGGYTYSQVISNAQSGIQGLQSELHVITGTGVQEADYQYIYVNNVFYKIGFATCYDLIYNNSTSLMENFAIGIFNTVTFNYTLSEVSPSLYVDNNNAKDFYIENNVFSFQSNGLRISKKIKIPTDTYVSLLTIY